MRIPRLPEYWREFLCVGCIALLGWPGLARAQSSLEQGAFWQLLTAPPAEAAGRLELAQRAMSELRVAGRLNPTLEIDLLRVKIQALADMGRLDETASLFERKAELVEVHRLTIRYDPIAFYETARTLHAGSGRSEAAGRSEKAIRRLNSARGLSARDRASRASNTSRVRLLYATDRARSGTAGPGGYYLPERGVLERGEVLVSIPPGHRRGQIEAPSLLRLETGPDARRHVTLEAVTPQDTDAFHAHLDAALSAARSREILVYIHGFNVGFDAAMRRAAQLAYDLQYDGVPIVYSWPSRGSTFGYVADTATVRHSARHLAGFLETLVARHPGETIHLVAHSMGNVALSDSLELLALRLEPDEVPLPAFEEVVFAAPDVDAGLFAAMAQTFRPLAKRMTVYASSEDLALAVSRRIHGDTPRMGQGGEALVTVDGVESIDMSAAGADLLAHNYYAQNWSALVDIMTLLWRDVPPGQRCGLNEVKERRGAAWRMEPGICGDRSVIEMLVDLKAIGATDPDEVAAYLDWRESQVDLDQAARAVIMQLFEPAD